MYMGKKNNVSEINFLDSEKFVSFTRQVDKDTPGVKDGIVPAGTVFPKNDATAEGITINDVDVSNGPQAVGVIVEGYINAARLPLIPASDAVIAMKKITFSNVKEG